MSALVANLLDGRSFPVYPIRCKANASNILVLVQRADMPHLRPFWVQSKSLRLVPGTFTDYMVAMRSVPGWVEDECERRIIKAVTIVRVRKAGGGKASSVGARAAKGERIPAA